MFKPTVYFAELPINPPGVLQFQRTLFSLGKQAQRRIHDAIGQRFQLLYGNPIKWLSRKQSSA